MRLLTPPAGKSLREIENAKQEVRTQQLEQIIRDKRKEIEQVEHIAVEALSKHGLENYEDEKRWKTRIAELTLEVEGLEQRRRTALLPLEKREKELTIKDRVLSEREEKLSIKETDLESVQEALAERLDDLSERQLTASEYATSLEQRNSNLVLQESEIQKRQDALVVILRQTNEEKQINETNLSTQIALLKGREKAISQRERVVEKKEKGFVSREKAILDKYETLRRAISEMKLRYGDKLNIKL